MGSGVKPRRPARAPTTDMLDCCVLQVHTRPRPAPPAGNQKGLLWCALEERLHHRWGSPESALTCLLLTAPHCPFRRPCWVQALSCVCLLGIWLLGDLWRCLNRAQDLLSRGVCTTAESWFPPEFLSNKPSMWWPLRSAVSHSSRQRRGSSAVRGRGVWQALERDQRRKREG